MYHIFIHLSVNGHLGCFHVLAIVNSAAMNIGVHVSFQIMVFSRYMPRSGIAGSYGSSFFFHFFLFFFLFFWLHSTACGILVPWPGIEPLPPAVEAQSLNHWTTGEVPVCRFFFDDGHSNWYEVIPHCSFDLYFSISDVDHLFMCFLAICKCSFVHENFIYGPWNLNFTYFCCVMKYPSFDFSSPTT